MGDAVAFDEGQYLARIEAIHDNKTLVKELAHLHAVGVGAAFDVGSEVDMKDAAHMIAGIGQGGLGLPDRDYYVRDDARAKEIWSGVPRGHESADPVKAA